MPKPLLTPLDELYRTADILNSRLNGFVDPYSVEKWVVDNGISLEDIKGIPIHELIKKIRKEVK